MGIDKYVDQLLRIAENNIESLKEAVKDYKFERNVKNNGYQMVKDLWDEEGSVENQIKNAKNQEIRKLWENRLTAINVILVKINSINPKYLDQ